VRVLAPGTTGTRTPDGLFDVEGIGEGGALRWPNGTPVDTLVVADELNEAVNDLLTRAGAPSASFLTPPDLTPPGDGRSPRWRHLPVGAAGASPLLSPYVPVSTLAARHRHHGFGFTGYHLVLAGSAPEDDPPSAAAWLGAAFHDADVVVVSAAVASAWKGRALRGRVSVDTRMDLWRLMAHAAVCIDLEPGPLFARECVEALRFGTPVVVPEEAGAAAAHARAGGGATFADASELIAAVGELCSGPARAAASGSGRRYADDGFGDPARLVGQLDALMR
jgi:hypothetical protein